MDAWERLVFIRLTKINKVRVNILNRKKFDMIGFFVC